MSGRARQQEEWAQEQEQQESEHIGSGAGVGEPEPGPGGDVDGSHGRHGTSETETVSSGVLWVGGVDGSERDGSVGDTPGEAEGDGSISGTPGKAEEDGSVGGVSGRAERDGSVGGTSGRAEKGGSVDGRYGRTKGGEFGGGARGGAPVGGGGDESAARRIALDALSRAARTRGQLEALLQRKGIEPEAAAAVLDRFEEVGLIDDRDYAETFVESRHRVRGQGGRALSMELRRRGVAGDVIAEAVGGLDPEREFETACRIARARYERMPAVSAEVKMRRLVGFLARKGYSGAIVTRAVRHVVDTADSSAVEALDGMAQGDEGGVVGDRFGEDDGV